MTSARGWWPALVLALIVGAGHALALRSAPVRAPASTWGLVELVLPGLFATGGEPAARPFSAPAPPAEHALAWAALAPGDPPTLPAPYVGLLPLSLAFLALLPARASGGWPGAAARLALLAAAVAGGVWFRQSVLIVVPIAWLASSGLRDIRPRGEATETGPLLVSTVACVLLTAGLIAASLRAGFASDADALQPLLGRLGAGSSAWDPSPLALNAAHLRAVLDRSALAAFAGMTALLLHAKSRAAWSVVLVLAVAAADLALAAL